MSLVGKLSGTKMGDRAQRTRPGKAEERKVKWVVFAVIIEQSMYHRDFTYNFLKERYYSVVFLNSLMWFPF